MPLHMLIPLPLCFSFSFPFASLLIFKEPLQNTISSGKPCLTLPGHLLHSLCVLTQHFSPVLTHHDYPVTTPVSFCTENRVWVSSTLAVLEPSIVSGAQKADCPLLINHLATLSCLLICKMEITISC